MYGSVGASERSRVPATINDEILACNVACLRTAKISAGIAEFARIAKSSGRRQRDPRCSSLLKALSRALRRSLDIGL